MTAPLREQLSWARTALVEAGLDPADAALDADVLARHVLDWDRAQLLTRLLQPPPDHFGTAFAAAIARRIAREPVALIIGHREFWGLEFEVTRAVLIPRPETELIVEQALLRTRSGAALRIVDVGTGSGCIAVALGHELRSARVTALDRSAAALTVAARNVARHGLTGRVRLVRANLLDAITGPVDLIVSNPPYIAERDRSLLQPEITRFEPEMALFAADDGLAILRALIDDAASKLAPAGLLIVEFGAGQAPALRDLADAAGWRIETVDDLAGRPRVAMLSREHERRRT